MKENIGFIVTFAAMMAAILVLHGCTQMDRGDMSARAVDVYVRSNADECVVEVKGNFVKEITDDTVTLDHPLKGTGA